MKQLALLSAFLLLCACSARVGTVTGVVTNIKGERVAGVVVCPDGADGPSAVTDENGAYALKGIDPGTLLGFTGEGFIYRALVVPDDGKLDMTMAEGFVIPGDAEGVTYILENDTVRVQKVIDPFTIQSMDVDRESNVVRIYLKQE